MGIPVKQNQAVIWMQINGPGTEYEPMAVGEDNASLTGITLPIVNVTPQYGRDRFTKPMVISIDTQAPGNLPTATLTIYEQAVLNIFERMIARGCALYLQRRIVKCGVLDDPALWDKIMHMGNAILTQYNPGDGPALEYNGESMTAAGSMSFGNVIFLVAGSLSALTTPSTANVNGIDGIPDVECDECGYGYPGPDMILFAGDADGDVFFTTNGGGLWTNVATPPFASDIVSDLVANRVGQDHTRIIVGNGTTGAGKAEIGWADADFGDELNASFSSVTLDDTSVGDIVEALGWPFFSRLYIGSGGDIFLSTTQGESISSQLYTGATVVRGFSLSEDNRDVFAFGDTNLLLRERDKSGTFVLRSGPSGGVTFWDVAQANDGILYGANGQSLYKSTNRGGSAENWELLRDFGASAVVRKISLNKGDSQVFDILVNDSGGQGEVWRTLDGGNAFTRVTVLTNTGYNDYYSSEIDSNKLLIAANAGDIHQMAPA